MFYKSLSRPAQKAHCLSVPKTIGTTTKKPFFLRTSGKKSRILHRINYIQNSIDYSTSKSVFT